ncbi:hypothetical protein pb186bvf_009010 [Paramecium bursaria]
MQRQNRGILKHSQSMDQEKKGIQWDEQAIESHNLDRGNKMKISEPKTPYNDEPIEIEEEDINTVGEDEVDDHLVKASINKEQLTQSQPKKLDLNELNKKLQSEIENERKDMGSDSDQDEKKKKKHEDFIKKRNMHYNEKNKIKMALKQQKQMDDEQ